MVPRETGIGAVALGFLVALVHLAPGYLVGLLIEDGQDWLPRLESTAETILLYSYTLRGIAFLLGTVVVFALGYRTASRLDLRAEYRGFALTLAVGGFLGYVLGLVLFVLVAVDGPLIEEFAPLLPSVGLLLGRVVGIAVQFAIVGFAGAALAHLTADRDRAAEPG